MPPPFRSHYRPQLPNPRFHNANHKSLLLNINKQARFKISEKITIQQQHQRQQPE